MVLPNHVVNRIGSLTAQASKTLIKERLNAGFYPHGGLPHYSTNELKLPTIIPSWRGPKHSAAWSPIASSMNIHAELENWGATFGNRDWVLFEQGYWEFRRVTVGQANVVDLQLTGKMLEDMRIKWNLTQSNGKILAQVGAKATRTGPKRELAKLHLEIGWDTISSETVAYYIQNGNFPRQFAFWTDDEIRQIRDTLADYVLRYEDHRLIEGNTGGQFQPVPF